MAASRTGNELGLTKACWSASREYCGIMRNFGLRDQIAKATLKITRRTIDASHILTSTCPSNVSADIAVIGRALSETTGMDTPVKSLMPFYSTARSFYEQIVRQVFAFHVNLL